MGLSNYGLCGSPPFLLHGGCYLLGINRRRSASTGLALGDRRFQCLRASNHLPQNKLQAGKILSQVLPAFFDGAPSHEFQKGPCSLEILIAPNRLKSTSSSSNESHGSPKKWDKSRFISWKDGEERSWVAKYSLKATCFARNLSPLLKGGR